MKMPRLMPRPRLDPVMSVLVAERLRQQCTLADMAKRTGWTLQAISQYELNKRRVPLAYALAAAETLGLSLRALR